MSHYCSLTISSSALPFSFGFQSSPTSGSFPISWLFASGDLSIGASTSDSVLPMNIQLISFRVDWFDLRAVQGTLKSLPQQHNLKTSVLQHSAFLTVQLSPPYMITSKTIALTIRTFVSKVMSLLFNTLSRLVTAFLPRSKSFNFMAAVTVGNDFGAQENKLSLLVEGSATTSGKRGQVSSRSAPSHPSRASDRM